jgi:hypothetical protein
MNTSDPAHEKERVGNAHLYFPLLNSKSSLSAFDTVASSWRDSESDSSTLLRSGSFLDMGLLVFWTTTGLLSELILSSAAVLTSGSGAAV